MLWLSERAVTSRTLCALTSSARALENVCHNTCETVGRQNRNSPTPPPPGTDHLFLVWYHPLAVGTARHWALFVTASASITGATGTIYQVVDDRFALANLRPEARPNTVATSAQRYQGSALLGTINAQNMQSLFSHQAIEFIDDHNRDPANISTHDLSNANTGWRTWSR